jgi:ABC-2 type transport system permease protein
MKLWKSWVIATKDFSIFRKKKRIIYTLIILPLLFSIGLPLLISGFDHPTAEVVVIASTPVLLLNFFSFFYIFLAYLLPTTLASYSIISEKIDHSLEPLLATPITDGELFLGKSIASFLPCLISIYIGAVIFMVLVDVFTYNKIGYIFFPNSIMAVILLVAVPLTSILSVEINVIISSKVNDVRTASQLGTLLLIPFIGVYALLEASLVSLNVINLFIIFAILLVADIILFYINSITFQRDKILTKWK